MPMGGFRDIHDPVQDRRKPALDRCARLAGSLDRAGEPFTQQARENVEQFGEPRRVRHTGDDLMTRTEGHNFRRTKRAGLPTK
jgi:hypothetical protein